MNENPEEANDMSFSHIDKNSRVEITDFVFASACKKPMNWRDFWECIIGLFCSSIY